MKVVGTKESDNALLLISHLIETVEDFLNKRGIDIPNEEKAESDYPSLIYGSDYGELESEFEGVLLAWRVIENEEHDNVR